MNALRRFAVLHHTGIDAPHFDLLFETSETSQLTTFRLQTWPVFERATAIKLRDHRRAYLEYVGLVAGDRGRVDRVDEGVVQVTELAGAFVLQREDGRPFARLERVQGGEQNEWIFIAEGEMSA